MAVFCNCRINISPFPTLHEIMSWCNKNIDYRKDKIKIWLNDGWNDTRQANTRMCDDDYDIKWNLKSWREILIGWMVESSGKIVGAFNMQLIFWMVKGRLINEEESVMKMSRCDSRSVFKKGLLQVNMWKGAYGQWMDVCHLTRWFGLRAGFTDRILKLQKTLLNMFFF